MTEIISPPIEATTLNNQHSLKRVGVGIPSPITISSRDLQPAIISLDATTPQTAEDHYGKLITEKESKEGASGGSYIRKVLNTEGKKYLKDWFQRDFIEKDGHDEYGHINQKAYNKQIQQLKGVLIDKDYLEKTGKIRNINPSLRTNEQHFAASSIKSLEMHRRRLQDAEIRETLQASNSPWAKTIEQTQAYLQQQSNRLDPKYSRKAAEQMLIPVIKELKKTAESITDDQLAQRYIASRVGQILPLRLNRYLLDERNQNKQELSGRALIANALSPIDQNGNFQIDEGKPVNERFAGNLKLEAIKQRAGAQLDIYLNETYQDPTAMQQSGAEFLERYLNDQGIAGNQLIRELSGRASIEPNEIEEILAGLNEKNAEMIKRTFDYNSQKKPFIETTGGVSPENAIAKLQKMKASWGDFIRTPEQAADMLVEIYKTQGMTHEEAVLLVSDEKWVRELDQGAFLQAFEKKHGSSHGRYKMELVRKRLGFWDRRELAKAEKKLGRPIVTFTELENLVSSLETPSPVVNSLLKIIDNALHVVEADYTKKKADKRMAWINGMRLAIQTTALLPAAQFLAQELDELLIPKVDLSGKMVGVDTDNDGYTDKSVLAEQLPQFSTQNNSGERVIKVDSDNDGIVDFDLPTPMPEESYPQNTKSSTPEETSENLQFIKSLNEAAQKTENEKPLLERILNPALAPIIKGRIDYCNANPEWCNSVLGKEGKEFNGTVLWLIGTDDFSIGGRGDAIHGFVFNADTSEVTSLTLDRDIRTPGLHGGAPINTAWFVDQDILAKEGKYVYDPARGQRILAEATGLPADIVMEMSWDATEQLLKFLYESKNDPVVPIEIKPGQEFYPHSQELIAKAEDDGKFHEGTYYFTPNEVITFLRERKGDTSGTFGREERQDDFISQALSHALTPENFARLISEGPSLLRKLEETKKTVRVTSYLPAEIDKDHDGVAELYEWAFQARDGIDGNSGIKKTIQNAVQNDPLSFTNMLGKLVSNIFNRKKVIPTRESDQAQLVSDGTKFTLKGEGNKNIVFHPDPSVEQRIKYWESLRDWVHDTVIKASTESPHISSIMLLGDSILSNTKIPENINDRLTDVTFVGSEPHFADNKLMTELHPGFSSEKLLADLKNRQQDIFANGIPDTVIIQVGTNDPPAGLSKEQTIDNLTQIVTTLRSSNPNIKIVFGEVLPTNNSWNSVIPGLNEAIKLLASDLSTPSSHIVAADVADINPETELSADGIHQFLGGSADKKIVESLLFALRRLGLKTTP